MQCTSPASFGYAIGFVFKRVVAPEFTPKRSPDGTSLAENCRSELFNLLEKMSKFAALGMRLPRGSWRVMAVLSGVITNDVRTKANNGRSELGTRNSPPRCPEGLLTRKFSICVLLLVRNEVESVGALRRLAVARSCSRQVAFRVFSEGGQPP